MTGAVARAALGAAKLPPTSQPVEMTHTDVKGRMSPGDLVAEEPTGALRVCMQQVQHESLVDITELSTGTKGWTYRWIELRLSEGKGHDVILLKSNLRSSLHACLQ
jgi:hypothetical protein